MQVRGIDEVDEFIGRIAAQREADGQPEFIEDPAVYQVLDGILVGLRGSATGDEETKAARRRRAAERSRQRVPYD